MHKLKNTLILLVMIVVTTVTSFLAFGNTSLGMQNIHLGLDLAGGVSITYQAADENATPEQMDGALAMINSRLSALGYTEAQAYIENGIRIRVEIPGVSDADRAVEQIGKTAMLTFVGVDWDHLAAAGFSDEDVAACAAEFKANMEKQGYATEGTDFEGQAKEFLKSPGSAQFYFPKTLGTILQKAVDAGDAVVVLDGNDVANATAQHGQVSSNGIAEDYVKLELKSSGAQKFKDATTQYQGKYIAIRLDQSIVSFPGVSAVISDGTAVITGMADASEAALLASDIRGGALPIQLEDIEHSAVGATLGRDALSTSLKAAVIGFILILLFMIAIYRVPGVVASIALVFYISVELLILNLFKITLTLPGIAGIILSIGMAVDANVVIFARINEELNVGRGIAASISSGFRKALSAIVDGNVTTLLSAAVLWFLGSGTVKGFALTLAIGILLSMFTALVFANLMLKATGELLPEKNGLYKNLTFVRKDTKLKVIKNTKIWMIIPAVIVAVGIVFAILNGGFNMDTDFAGGTMLQIDMEQKYDNTELTNLVKEKTGDANPIIQAVSGAGQENVVSIKVIEQTTEQSTELYNAIAEKFGLDVENKTNLISKASISPTISGEMTRSAIIAIAVAAVLMLLYITLRFRNVRFGVSAIIALAHDVLIVVAMYAIFRIPVNTNFIAALLTIVGYSINNTIIVFDRIRENRRYYKPNQTNELADDSIVQTLGRSINTSITTVIMVLMLFILGVESIRWFSFPLLAGFVAGTYSSLLVASPVWVLLEKVGKKK